MCTPTDYISSVRTRTTFWWFVPEPPKKGVVRKSSKEGVVRKKREVYVCTPHDCHASMRFFTANLGVCTSHHTIDLRSTRIIGKGTVQRVREKISGIQGSLAHKKQRPPTTLQWDNAQGPIRVLEGWAFYCEQSTPVMQQKACNDQAASCLLYNHVLLCIYFSFHGRVRVSQQLS